jgi:hypothetical protein
MNHLLSLAFLILMLAPQNQKLPDEFHKLPEEVSAKATVIVAGTFVRGRGPCIFMADGIRRWPMESWFRIKKVHRGQVGGKNIYINSMMPSKKNEEAGLKLELDHDYLVLLRPNEESMKAIKAGAHVPAWDALQDDEIIAIVKLNSDR